MKSPRYPLPWWLIAHAPALAVANGAVYRAATCVAVAHWASGCADLPSDDTTLAALARLPVVAWRQVKSPALAALSQITPNLREAYEIRHRSYEARLAHAHMMTAKRAAKRAQQAMSAVSAGPILTQPTRSPPPPRVPVMQGPAGSPLPPPHVGPARRASTSSTGPTYTD
jgi:hypothetical protein